MILILIGNIEEGVAFINALNKRNFNNLIIAVQQVASSTFDGLKITEVIDFKNVPTWENINVEELEFVFDLTDNLTIAQQQWEYCIENQVPIIHLCDNEDFKNWTEDQNKSPFYWSLLKRGDDPSSIYAEIMSRMLVRNFA
ncbi:MAG: hypothetical protein JXR03_18560 [Cyclobacteriaceae bacterium]